MRESQESQLLRAIMRLRRLTAAAIFVVLILSASPSLAEGEPAGDWSSPEGFAGRDVSVFVDDEVIYAAYAVPSSARLAVRKFEDGVWSSVGPELLTPENAYDMAIVVENGVPYVAYDENYYTARGMSVMKFNKDTNAWEYIGGRAFSGGVHGTNLTLAVDNGNLYLSYEVYVGGGTNYEAHVLKYDPDSDAWGPLGGEHALNRSYYTLDLDMQVADGKVYVTRYRSPDENRYIHVEQFDDTVPDGEWVSLTEFTPVWNVPDASSNFSTAVYQGQVYNAHVNFYGESVVKRAGPNWQTIGKLATKVDYAYSRAAGPVVRFYAGMLYVAHSTVVDGVIQLVVDRYDGSEWTSLGSPIAAQANYMFEDVHLDIDQGTLTLGMLERSFASSSGMGDYKLYTFQDEVPVSVPPVLTADSRPRGLGDEVEIAFTDDGAWRDHIERVRVGDRTLIQHEDYVINETGIMIYPHVLSAGFLTISVLSEGYAGAMAIQAVLPDPPDPVAVLTTGDSYARISWSAVPGADEYRIYYSASPEVRDAADVRKITVNAGVVSLDWTITGLTNDVPAYFVLTTLSDGLESESSTPVQAVPELHEDAVGKPWRLLGDSFDGLNPFVLSAEGVPYVAYRDNGAITVMRYEDDVWTPVGNRQFTVSNAFDPVAAVDQGVLYAAFADAGFGNRAVVMKFADGHWVDVGVQPVSSGKASRLSLAMHEGTPYLAYVDKGEGPAASTLTGTLQIKRLSMDGDDAGEWESAGEPGIAQEQDIIAETMFARLDRDILYVAFNEADSGAFHLNALDLRAANPEWLEIAPAAEWGGSRTLALQAAGGKLHLARYKYNENAERIIEVWEYDRKSGQWANLGGGFPGQSAALDEDRGILYAAYFDPSGSEYRTVVQKYVNGSWYQTGSEVFPRGNALSALTFAVEADKPYVAYYNSGYQVEVRTLEPAAWCTVTWDEDVDGHAPHDYVLPCGEPVPEPEPDAERPNYYLAHWVTEDGEPFDFTQRIEQSMTLTAMWNLYSPANVRVEAYGDKEITLKWDAVPGATGYMVYRSTTSGSYGTALTQVEEPAFTDTDVANGTIYYYVVTATDGTVESEMSGEAGGTPRTVPDTPQDVAAEAGAAGTTASLRFNLPGDGGSDIIGYQVRVVPDTDSGLESYEVEELPAAESSDPQIVQLEIEGLQSNTGYRFQAAAVNGEGQSGWSEESNRILLVYGCTYLLFDKDGSSAARVAQQPCLDPVDQDKVRQGYAFGGWYQDEAFTLPFTPSDDHRDTELPLYAKWNRTADPLAEGQWHVLDQLTKDAVLLSSFAYEGSLYMAYWDDEYLSVRRYTDGAWAYVGNRRFAKLQDRNNVSYNQFASLYVDQGTPYVAFTDDAGSGRLMKLDSALDVWVNAVDDPFADQMFSKLTLGMYDGVPYVGYLDALTYQWRLKRWNGADQPGQWQDVGGMDAFDGVFVFGADFRIDGSRLMLAYSYLDLEADRFRVKVVQQDVSDPQAEWTQAGDASELPDMSVGNVHLQLFVLNGQPYVSYLTDLPDSTVSIQVWRLEQDRWEEIARRNWTSTDSLFVLLEHFSAAMDNDMPYVLHATTEVDMSDYSQLGSVAVERMARESAQVGETLLNGEPYMQTVQLQKAGDRLYAIYTPISYTDMYETEYQTLVRSLTLEKCKAVFDRRDGTDAIERTVNCGEFVSVPDPDPLMEGYVFGGWYEEEQLLTPFDGESPVFEDKLLYAKWLREVPDAPTGLAVKEVGDGYILIDWEDQPLATGYRVYASLTSSEYPGANATVTDSVYADAAITVTDSVYTAAGLTNGTRYYFTVTAFNESGESDSSTEVSAVPGLPVCTVNFDSQGGSAMAPQSVTCGDSAALPAPDPVREGYQFAGWYTDEDYTQSYGFEAAVTGDITLHAKWEAAPPEEEEDPDEGPDPGGEDPDEGSGPGGEAPGNGPDSGGEDPDDGSAPGSEEGAAPEAEGTVGVELWIDGQREPAGRLKIVKENGATVATMSIDMERLPSFNEADAAGGTITLPFDVEMDTVVGALQGHQVKQMEQREMTIEIRTNEIRYAIPASQIKVDRLAEQWGESVRLEDIAIRIQVAPSSPELRQIAERAAASGSFALVVPPVSFTITAEHEGRTTEVTGFEVMVERLLRIPDNVDPGEVTTAVVIGPDGRLRHVPTRIEQIDGSYYARVNSLTNSDYTLIRHHAAFEDVEHHWSKQIVNDLGGRLVISGYGDGRFHPERAITRGEFAMIVARALGFGGVESETAAEVAAAVFADVDPTNPFSGAIRESVIRGLISGYPNGEFRPAERITREQAMVVIARALELINLRDAAHQADNADADGLARLAAFEDGDQVSDWARQHVAELLHSGVVSGRSATRLAPASEVTRAEAAAMIHRLLRTTELIN